MQRNELLYSHILAHDQDPSNMFSEVNCKIHAPARTRKHAHKVFLEECDNKDYEMSPNVRQKCMIQSLYQHWWFFSRQYDDWWFAVNKKTKTDYLFLFVSDLFFKLGVLCLTLCNGMIFEGYPYRIMLQIIFTTWFY